MTSEREVKQWLREVKTKLRTFGIVFLDRPKNTQTLLDLEISPAQREAIILALEVQDYAEGPIPDVQFGGGSLYVFGKELKGKEIYVKISPGPRTKPICISFHLAEYAMKYPFREIRN